MAYQYTYKNTCTRTHRYIVFTDLIYPRFNLVFYYVNQTDINTFPILVFFLCLITNSYVYGYIVLTFIHDLLLIIL